MELDQAINAFFVETRELLESMEAGLLQLESAPDDAELINAIFRAAHNIKGSAGMFGFDPMVAFTHDIESLLDRVRAGEIAITAELSSLLLQCRDHIQALLDPLAAGIDLPLELSAQGEGLLARLKPYLAAGVPVPAQRRPGTECPQRAVPPSGGCPAATDCWHLSLRFGRDVLRNGMDPLAFLRYLTTLGDIVHLTTLADTMPPAAEMDPESCYLGFEISFKSEADKAAIENAFEFVRDDCQLRILPPRSVLSDYIRLIQELPGDTLSVGEILVASGALTQAELQGGLEVQAHETGRLAEVTGAVNRPVRPLGEILVEDGTVHPSVALAALAKQQQVMEQKARDGRYLRVDAEKLDQLIDLVGELVVAGAGTQILAQRRGIGELYESTAVLSHLIEEVRDSALSLRMVQIGATFQRFQRVVRDMSRALGKDIMLRISGGETELDKSVVEEIGDPLMHLIRNAVDHGTETVETRLAAGKPGQATISLNAYHDAGSIVIEVADDGAGLNREKILRRAIERGLVDPGRTLSDTEVFNLIFEPGFSTVDAPSNLSGRGVGMDVVKRNVESLRGTVQLESPRGQGSTVRIRLPLTLAIIDGFLVGVGHARYVIPVDMLVECLECSQADREATRRRGYLRLREEVLPIVRLKDFFRVQGPAARRENIAVVQFGNLKAGLVVDDLLGEFQTVIKPLGRLFQHVDGIGGSTILGTGEVALILDVPGLIKCLVSAESVRVQAMAA
ncbi:MAG: chemotaxis protein CheW [Gammaproteobacteria bacterium]